MDTANFKLLTKRYITIYFFCLANKQIDLILHIFKPCSVPIENRTLQWTYIVLIL